MDENGEHLFSKRVDEFIIRNTPFKRYNFGRLDQMRDGTIYVASLIAKNPNIKIIDLSDTSLGDNEAAILNKSIEKNTNLIAINLSGKTSAMHF